jgi:hypothetical protein
MSLLWIEHSTSRLQGRVGRIEPKFAAGADCFSLALSQVS